MRICSIVGCGKKHKAKGYCNTHYISFHRYGDPLINKYAPHSHTEKQRAKWIFKHKTEKISNSKYNGTKCRQWLGQIHTAGYIPVMPWKGKTANAAGFLRKHLLDALQPKGSIVLHKCQTRACVNPHHVFFGSHKENTKDAILAGNHISGRKGRHNLAETEVMEIYRRLKDGEQGVDLACEFGVHKNSIYDINHGRSWNHLTGAK